MADGKTCIICGADCTDIPRIKNSKGQYACQACVEKRKAQKSGDAKPPAPGKTSASGRAAAAAGGSSLMEQWASKSTEGQIAMGEVEQPTCPKCETPMMPDSVVCMGCGFNTQSGKKIYTKIQKPEKDKSGGGGGSSVSLDGNGLAVVSVLATIGLIAGTALAGDFGALFILIAVIWMLIAWILMVVAAFQDGDTLWGWIGLAQLVPFIGWVAGLAFSFYYCIVGSTQTVRKISYWCAYLALLGSLIAAFVTTPEAFPDGF